MGQFTFESSYGKGEKSLELIRHLGGGIELRYARGSVFLSERECKWLMYTALPGLLAKVAEEPS